jgi:tetratricopeptide (TPR) repeat protein
LYPEDHELYYYLGIEYRILKEYENAISAFLNATQLKDDNAYYYFNLGVSYERLGKIDDAIFYLDKSIQLDGANAMALNYLGYLLADKGIRLYEAKEFIEKALTIDPDNGAYLDSIGWVHYRLSDYGKAKEYLERAIQFMDITEEENYLIYEHLGDTYNKIGLYNEAIDAWEKALEMRFVDEIQFKIEKLKKELPKFN